MNSVESSKLWEWSGESWTTLSCKIFKKKFDKIPLSLFHPNIEQDLVNYKFNFIVGKFDNNINKYYTKF